MLLGDVIGVRMLLATVYVICDDLVAEMLVEIVAVKARLDVTNHSFARSVLWVWRRGHEVTSGCFLASIGCINGCRVVLSLNRVSKIVNRGG